MVVISLNGILVISLNGIPAVINTVVSC